MVFSGETFKVNGILRTVAMIGGDSFDVPVDLAEYEDEDRERITIEIILFGNDWENYRKLRARFAKEESVEDILEQFAERYGVSKERVREIAADQFASDTIDE